MNRQKLIYGWLIITIAMAVLSLLMLWGSSHRVVITAMALVCLSAGIVTWWSWHLQTISARGLRHLTEYASALSRNPEAVPKGLAPELIGLSEVLQRTATEIHRIAANARVELSRRETILAGMAEGVLAVDHKLQVTFCNGTFADTFQTRTPVREGRPLYETVRETALRDILREVLETHKAVRQKLHLRAAVGHWFEIHALPLGEGSQAGAIAVLRDVSDVHRQEQARKDFVANVSHELRTPLAAIRGYAETLLDGALEDRDNNRRFVEIIQAQAIRLNNIASDLLVLSEFDSNAPVASPDKVNIGEVIESTLRTVEGSARLRNVTLESIDCGEGMVLGYRFRLEQALVNLVDNAVKFNRKGGTVTIQCHYDEPGFIHVSVSDTGIGIPSEDLSRVFERFYRVDKARSREAGGTGLGLSIVKETVSRMGGSIAVESQYGKGSKFTIRLQRPA